MDEDLLIEIARKIDFGDENDLLVKSHRDEPEVINLFANLSKVEPFCRYSTRVLETILDNTLAVQLENRCKCGCPFCGFTFNPTKGEYKQFPVEVLRTLSKKELGSLKYLYLQSDPFSYEMPIFEESNELYHYPEIHKIFRRNLHIVTSVPIGREEIVMQAINAGMNLIISLSDHNRERLQKYNFPKKFAKEIEIIRAGKAYQNYPLAPFKRYGILGTNDCGVLITPYGIFNFITDFINEIDDFDGLHLIPISSKFYDYFPKEIPLKEIGKYGIIKRNDFTGSGIEIINPTINISRKYRFNLNNYYERIFVSIT